MIHELASLEWIVRCFRRQKQGSFSEKHDRAEIHTPVVVLPVSARWGRNHAHEGTRATRVGSSWSIVTTYGDQPPFARGGLDWIYLATGTFGPVADSWAARRGLAWPFLRNNAAALFFAR